MPVVFALVSALAYGVSDFMGGVFAKRSSPWQVAVVGQTSSALSAFAIGLVITGTVATADWWWAAAAGVGGGVGVAFLYRGLAMGRMSVVAPTSAIGAATLPVVIGVAMGDRPNLLAVVGIIVAFPAIYLISRDPEKKGSAGGVLDGVLAGIGFGSLFTFLGQIGPDAGLMPIAVMQLGTIGAVIALAVMMRKPWVPRQRQAWAAVLMGPLGAVATGSFLLATHDGLLSVISVIASLYPATTVVLAAVLLREQIHRAQGIGLAVAATAVVLVAIG